MLDSLYVCSRYNNSENWSSGEKKLRHHQKIVSMSGKPKPPGLFVLTAWPWWTFLISHSIEESLILHAVWSHFFFLPILGSVLSRCVPSVMPHWQSEVDVQIMAFHREEFCCLWVYGPPYVSKWLLEVTRVLVNIAVIQDLHSDCASSVCIRTTDCYCSLLTGG